MKQPAKGLTPQEQLAELTWLRDELRIVVDSLQDEPGKGAHLRDLLKALDTEIAALIRVA